MNIRRGLKKLALPCPEGDRVKTAIDRASRKSGIPYARAREIWYGNAHRVEQNEIEKVRRALQKDRNQRLLDDWNRHKAQMARIEALLLQDEEFYSAHIAAFKLGMGPAG